MPREWPDRGTVTRIPGTLGAHSSRRDAPGLRPVPCATSSIVGSSFGLATPPVAWSVDVQCDTCQVNTVSGFPKVAWTKSGLHVYCGLDRIR